MVYVHINVYRVNICLLFCVVKFKLCFEIIKEKWSGCARIVTLCMNFQLVSLERYNLSNFIC